MYKLIDSTFGKFILVGIVNTILGTSIMFIAYNVLGFNYWISSLANYFLGSIFSYILNRIFTFKNTLLIKDTLPRFIINIVICYLVSYGLAKSLISYLLRDISINIQENIAMLIGMSLFIGLNYIGQRFFVFNNHSRAEEIK